MNKREGKQNKEMTETLPLSGTGLQNRVAYIYIGNCIFACGSVRVKMMLREICTSAPHFYNSGFGASEASDFLS